MNILLKSISDVETLSLASEDPNIESFIEQELDGAELVNILLNLSAAAPVVVGSVAATLTALNKSIDEFKKLTKMVFLEHPENEEVGVYKDSMKVLSPNATDKEIDDFFDALKEKAKSEISVLPRKPDEP